MASTAPVSAMPHDNVESQLQTRQFDMTKTSSCSNATTMTRRKAKQKNESLSSSMCATLVQHQLGLSVNLLLLLAMTHSLFPALRPHTSQYFTLSYYDEETGLYNQGWHDLKLVSFWIIVFTGLRAAMMDYVLVPMARLCGVQKKKTTVRFAEQAWLLIYYSLFWTLGMYLMYKSDYFFNLPAMWHNFPTRSMTGLFKWYYLAQFAFWLQQIVVVHIEEKRKDHWQMFSHHIITCTLLFTSYGNYQTKVGNTILCLMDVVDLVFPTAKMLKYAGMQALCDFTFVVFIVSWFVARHVFYGAVCWSIYKDLPVEQPFGCYNAITGERTSDDGGNDILSNLLHAYSNSNADVCFNSRTHWSFLGLLLALQVITIIWFGMICRVAYRVVTGKGADDSRSDGEDEEETEEEEEDEKEEDADIEEAIKFKEQEQELRFAAPQEEEVGAESLSFSKRKTSPTPKRTMKSRASGISIPGDHKELLGRIGCDKPSNG